MPVTSAIVGEAYRRCYATPIRARSGDHGLLVRRDDEDAPEWVWVEHRDTGRGGWTPWSAFDRIGDGAEVVFRRDYDAIELDVEAGQVVRQGERIGVWVWCETEDGVAGWIPGNKLLAHGLRGSGAGHE